MTMTHCEPLDINLARSNYKEIFQLIFLLLSSKNKKRSNQTLIRKFKMNIHITTSHNHTYLKTHKNK